MTDPRDLLPASFVLRDPAVLPAGLARPVLAIGNFDGFHLGHAALFAEARELARELGAPVCALTFDPHPRAGRGPIFLLTPPLEKARLLAAAGADAMIALTFDQALMSLSPEIFIDEVLVGRFDICGVVVGENFRFGRNRSGGARTLVAAGEGKGFATRVHPGVKIDGAFVSSSAIRAALGKGDVAAATRLLGHLWRIAGAVVHGDKRGRDLGFPTANLLLDPDCGLAHGIYAVRVEVEGARHDGVASFGRRPTFDDGAPRFETFLLDFDGDLYGKTIAVDLVAFLRGEARFGDAGALIEQMNRDVARARHALRAAPAPCA